MARVFYDNRPSTVSVLIFYIVFLHLIKLLSGITLAAGTVDLFIALVLLIFDAEGALHAVIARLYKFINAATLLMHALVVSIVGSFSLTLHLSRLT